ncbi:MAG: SDR family NAD(P)-dependent oxidoreductase, partial [Bacteroidetes bacterium]
AASKHALHGFFETLYFELAPSGIAVTIVNPGRIRTEISLNALTASGKAHGEMDPGQDRGMSAEACAKAIIQGIYRKKPEINVGNAEIVMVYLKRYAPWLFRIIARRTDAK